VIWECGLGGEESDLGTWIRWRGKSFGSVDYMKRKVNLGCGLGEEESELRVWIRWRGSNLRVWIRWRGK
jgi:hypothetical protein